jgi:hypothetical protein
MGIRRRPGRLFILGGCFSCHGRVCTRGGDFSGVQIETKFIHRGVHESNVLILYFFGACVDRICYCCCSYCCCLQSIFTSQFLPPAFPCRIFRSPSVVPACISAEE